jgi:hypothetical protein
MKSFRHQLAVLVMVLAACLMANGCFSCSTREERINNPTPPPVGSSGSITDPNAQR